MWYADGMQKPPLLVSLCLLGQNCRYNASCVPLPLQSELEKCYELVGVCPEILGGLPTPRSSAELVDGRVRTQAGQDLTQVFMEGARKALKIAQEKGCTQALLMNRSPSCGLGMVYDGTFQGNLVPGNGVFADLLLQEGFTLVAASQASLLLPEQKNVPDREP